MNKVYIKTNEQNLSSISANGKNYEVINGVALVDADCVDSLLRHGFEVFYPVLEESHKYEELVPADIVEFIHSGETLEPKNVAKKRVKKNA